MAVILASEWGPGPGWELQRLRGQSVIEWERCGLATRVWVS